MSTFEIPTEQEFDEQFLSLLTGVPAIFPVDPTDDGNLNDVEKVMYAEQRLKDFRLRAKERVDHARDDLRGECKIRFLLVRTGTAADLASLTFDHTPELTAIARDHKQAELASQRSSAHPTTQAHEAKMTGMRQARLATMKANSELEQQVYRLQGELERLQQELKDEEAEAVDALELDSEMSVLLSFLEGVPQPSNVSLPTNLVCASNCIGIWASCPSRRRTEPSPRLSSVSSFSLCALASAWRLCAPNADDQFQQAHKVVEMRGQSRSTIPCPTTSGARSYGTSQADERRESFVLLPFVARVVFLACVGFCQCCRPVSAPLPCRLYTFSRAPLRFHVHTPVGRLS
jgi:hypothetical protein